MKKKTCEIFEEINSCHAEMMAYLKGNKEPLSDKLWTISKDKRNKHLALYRYRQINDYSLDEIMNDYVYLSKVSAFDDVYDSKACADSATASAYEVARQISTKSTRIYEKEFDDTNKMAEEILRIACFSKTFKNTLMWYYCADQYRGMCIKYEFTENDKVALFPVDYVSERENDYSLITLEKVLRNTILKNKEWAHEKEWRIINIVGKEFQKGMKIKEIYFGYETPEVYIKLLRAWLSINNKNIALFQMEKGKAGKWVAKPIKEC